MNLCSLIAFLGENKISLCLKEDRIDYRSPIKIPSDILDLLRVNRHFLIQSLMHYNNRHVIVSPQSYNQQSLFFSYLLAKRSSSYNVAVPMKIFSPVDFFKMQTVLDSLVKFHDQLRTTFSLISNDSESVPCQIIPFEQKSSIFTVDVSDLSQEQIEESVFSFCNNPFNLSESPAFRTVLFSRDKSEHILVFLFHHIICDAHSIGIFLDSFNRLYCDKIHTLSQNLSYSDFAVHQMKYLEKNQQQLLHYWKCRSDCDRGISLKTDYIPKKVNNKSGKSIYFSIDNNIVNRVILLSHQMSITRFSFYFSCFQLLYMLKSGSLNATIGVLSSGRSNTRFVNTIGYFVNPLPVFCNRSGNLKLKDHLKMTHKEICESLDHQNLPFSLLVGNISVQRVAERPVLFSAVFNMLSRKQLGIAADLVYPDKNPAEITVGGMKTQPYHINQQEGQFDITLELLERDNHIQGILKYDSDLFTRNTAENFVSIYNSILKEIIDTNDICISDILTKFNNNNNFVDSQHHRWYLSIAATFTANLLQESFQFWEMVTGIKIVTVFSPYYQIEQSLMHPEFSLSDQLNYSIFLLRLEDLAYQNDLENGVDIEYVQNRAFDLTDLVIKSAWNSSKKIIVVFCPASVEVLSNQITKADFNELERIIIERFKSEQNIYCISSEKLLQSFGSDSGYESLYGKEAKVPYTEYFYEHIGKVIIRTVYAFEKPPGKAIILDCDNTLWTGVAGEDQVSQITISDQVKQFQHLLKNYKDMGVLLCLCSKNNRQDIVNIFENHSDMILKLQDISFERINWQSKSHNIAEIADEANLTTAGMIFIDDNPTECAEVKAYFPDITVVHLADTIEDRISYIKNFWAFDILKVTTEDLSRIEKYQIEKYRADFRNQTSSFSEFINGLNLKINIRNSTVSDIPRISQLSYRTNQFTTGTPGLSEKSVHESMVKYDLFVVEVSDRFGDYGLVGVIKGKKELDSYEVDSFFLSCRSLGRGVEHYCLSFIGGHARAKECQTVKFIIHMTARNKPLQLFFQSTLSAYHNIDNSMQVYRVPSLKLQQTTFNPDEYSQHPVSKNQNNKPITSVPDRFCLPDTILHKIAMEYSKAETLHQHILDMRKSKFSSAGVVESIHVDSMQKPVTSSIEDIIHRIWSDSLGKEDISFDQNFFDAGGNSIMLPHIIQKVYNLLQKDVSLVELFQYPTISSLAVHLSTKTVNN